MDLDDVPEDTRLWKPETAPQAMVMNRMGNSGWPFTVKPTKAGIPLMEGFVTKTPMTPPAIMPSSRKELR